MDFYVVAYSISLCLAVITITSTVYVLFTKWKSFYVLPKGLRFYFIITFFPFAMLYTVSSMSITILYLINRTQKLDSINNIAMTLTFSVQTIRTCFFLFIVERIIATTNLERYQSADKISLFWKMFSFSMSTSLLFVICVIFSIEYSFTEYLNIYVTAIHIFTIGTAIILHLLNKRMYKVTVYRVTLKKRHQIMKNIKILSFIFPSILIYNFMVPIGSLLLNIAYFFNLPTMPHCILHFVQNLSILIIVLRHYFIKHQPVKNVKTKKVTVIKNAFGKNLPATINSDKYFNDLKELWN